MACNGDVLTDLDLTALMAAHRAPERPRDARAAHRRGPAPLRGGGDRGRRRVTAFVEKPEGSRAGAHHQRRDVRARARRAGSGARGAGGVDRTGDLSRAGRRRPVRIHPRLPLDRHWHAGLVPRGQPAGHRPGGPGRSQRRRRRRARDSGLGGGAGAEIGAGARVAASVVLPERSGSADAIVENAVVNEQGMVW